MNRMLRSHILTQYREFSVAEKKDVAAKIMPDGSPVDVVHASLLGVLLPDLVAGVEQVIVQAEEKPKVRAFAGGLLTYVYNPLDLIPDDGPLGWMDDAVICALGLQRLQEAGDIALDEHMLGACEFALRVLPLLNSEFRQGIEAFIAGLDEKSGVVAG